MTDLHYAAYCGDLNALRHFLEVGSTVNAADTYRGYTATHWLTDMAAAGGSRIEMLKLLVQYGADVNIKTPDGTTALMLAREAGSAEGDLLASMLIEFGALEN